jgi:hypothetical protein
MYNGMIDWKLVLVIYVYSRILDVVELLPQKVELLPQKSFHYFCQGRIQVSKLRFAIALHILL